MNPQKCSYKMAGGEGIQAFGQKKTDNFRVRENPEEIFEETNLFDDLFEHAPVGYVVLGPDGQIHQVNPAGAALLDEDRHALAGFWFGAFVADTDCLEYNSFLQRVFLTGSRETCEIGVNDKQGRLLFVRLEGIATDDRQECCVMIRDVTESRIVRQSMAFNESKYRTLFENINVAFSYYRLLLADNGQILDSVLIDPIHCIRHCWGVP